MKNCEKKEYKLIDVFKLVFAISIFFWHTNIFRETQYYRVVAAIFFYPSVLFFFVATGFFIGGKCIKNLENFNLRGYIVRIGTKLIVFESMAIILAMIRFFVEGVSLHQAIFRIIRSIVFYPYGAMWYLQAVIIAVILLTFTIKEQKSHLIIPVGIVLYSFALLGTNYFFVIQNTQIEPIFKTVLHYIASFRNGIFVGYYFIGIGVLISLNWENIQGNKSRINWLFLIGCIIYCIEMFLLYGKTRIGDDGLYLSSLVFVPLLFIILASQKIEIRNAVLLRNLSTSIYLIHSIVLSFLGTVMLSLGIRNNKSMETLLAIVIISSILYVVYDRKPKTIYELLI